MARKRTRKAGPLEAAGPRSWRNWRVKRRGQPVLAAVEVPLFSDAWFTAEALDLGPYKLLNALASTPRGKQHEWKPAVVLRAEHCLPAEVHNMLSTDDEHYHGGTLYDEVAALTALLLGVRMVAGPIEREFGYTNDPLGRPRGHSAAVLPVLPQRVDAPQIASLFGTRTLSELGLLQCYPDISAAAAVALTKSARLYQQALWVCDTSPETAWLLLVSAIETAASFWNAETITPEEQLEISYPDLTALLRANPVETLIADVAEELHLLIASAGKFVGFCLIFKPPPPEQRPKFGRFDFERESYEKAIKKIYRFRSRALHGGIPFPHPICQPPMSGHDGTDVPEERPSGLGAGSRGATWGAEDLPMHLHLFAHIARGALLAWWGSLASPAHLDKS